MTTPFNDIAKRGRPKQPGTPVMVRLQGEQLAALDEWISKQEGNLSRPEAVRRLMVKGLLERPGQ